MTGRKGASHPLEDEWWKAGAGSPCGLAVEGSMEESGLEITMRLVSSSLGSEAAL
ncbi:MAG: hypothetical protein OXU81_11205 [Gammaproteobacteria bacterium]|nr:hypothetical protein [Gammaproteobacteria bacterium]